MIFPYDSEGRFSDSRAASPTQRPASNSDARKRARPSGFSPADGASDPHLDNGFAEVIRKAQEKAWIECAKEACDLGWMHEHGEQDVLERNPYRSAS